MSMHSHPTLAELETAGPAIRALVRRVVRDDATADDVMQETRLRALERPPPDGSNRRGWLAVVARNLAFRERRSAARRRRRQERVARPEATRSTAAALERLEAHRRVVECVEALDPSLRVLVVERYFEGESASCIAERHGISRATVDRRLASARASLRDMLAPRRRDGTRRFAPAVLALGGSGIDGLSEGTLSAAATTGGLIVGTKTILAVAGVAAVSFAAGWTLGPGPAPELQPAPGDRATAEPALRVAPTLEGAAPAHVETQAAVAQVAEEEVPLPTDAEAWLRQINDAPSAIALQRSYRDLCRLPPEVSRDILLEIFPRIEPEARRRVCLSVVTDPSWKVLHPHAVAILQLGVTDPHLRVQNHALRVLKTLTHVDFSEDLRAYERWHAEHGSKEVKVVLREGVLALVARTRALTGAALDSELERNRRLRLDFPKELGIDMRTIYLEAGTRDRAQEIWLDASQSKDARKVAGEWLAALGVGEAWLREHVLPLVVDPDDVPQSMYLDALRQLGANGWPWVKPYLLGAFETAPRTMDWWQLAGLLAAHEDPSVIPTMIGMIQAHDRYHSVYGIGYFGLSKLTGVDYDEAHDGAWWDEWWENNKHRFPPDVQAMEIPRLDYRAKGINGD